MEERHFAILRRHMGSQDALIKRGFAQVLARQLDVDLDHLDHWRGCRDTPSCQRR